MKKTQTIVKLETKLNSLKVESNSKIEAIREKLQIAYNEIFEADMALKAACDKLECSNEYGSNEAGIYHWIRFDASDYADSLEYLEVYLRESRCIEMDSENDSLFAYDGPSIIINDDGDCLDQDSGKWFLSHKDYDDDAERNERIESWMEKNGYFPGVFREDRHGNVFPISTKV